jgi:hypothetical protein
MFCGLRLHNSLVLSALIAAFGAPGCSVMCANQVQKMVPSPDGKHKAVVFLRDCGATAWSADVSIIDVGDELANRGGNVLVAGGPWVVGSGDRGSILRIAVSWESATRLAIKYDPRADVTKKETAHGGVSLVYEPIGR